VPPESASLFILAEYVNVKRSPEERKSMVQVIASWESLQYDGKIRSEYGLSDFPYASSTTMFCASSGPLLSIRTTKTTRSPFKADFCGKSRIVFVTSRSAMLSRAKNISLKKSNNTDGE
jgi:hypothetical protein